MNTLYSYRKKSRELLFYLKDRKRLTALFGHFFSPVIKVCETTTTTITFTLCIRKWWTIINLTRICLAVHQWFFRWTWPYKNNNVIKFARWLLERMQPLVNQEDCRPLDEKWEFYLFFQMYRQHVNETTTYIYRPA